MQFDFGALRRLPDVEGEGLEASDAADRLLLDEAAARLASAGPDEVVVLDDAYGAIALGAAAAGARGIRVHQDTVTGERALAENARRLGLAPGDTPRSLPLGPELVAGARLVLLRLPRSLDRLDELAELVARHADSDAVVVAAGRIKHMSLAMNDVLGTWFGRVDVSHARQKSRVLTARGRSVSDAPAGAPGPHRRRGGRASSATRELGLTVVAHGGVFAGTGVDIGTRFLLGQLVAAVPDAASAVDLACGSGVVAAWLARERPGVVVRATDRSAAAAASAA